uniref:GspE/PulE family protein n=1 Tax=Hydrogenophaga sp. TaxID=1904254 RepID=UPI0035650CBD
SADAIVEEVRRHFLPLPPDQAGAQERLDWEDLVMQAMVEVGDSLAEAGHAVLASESPAVVRLVNQLIGDAFAQRVSEIQIESKSDAALTAVRFRHQGELQPQLWLPAKLREPLVSRIKRMAGLDVAERRRLQEGRIDFAEFGGQALTLRVVAPPARAGVEELALRLLTLSRPAALVRLGLRARDRVALAGLSQRRHGLVLVVGPRGSGRTTTLHAVLAEVDSVERKVWSAEDPVEFQQLGVRQVQLNPRIGLDAVRAVNGFVQAGADVIALGELRDADTAHAIVAAAVNGPLALSTLPTDTACETVVHLLEQGVDAARLAGAMQGIVAQRLVRALCRHCASPRVLAPDEWDALLQEYMEGSNLSRPQAQVRLLAAAALPTPDQVKVRHAVGCEHCGGKGYRGRTGVFEILQNSPAIRQLIQHRAQPEALRDAAVAEGMRSLRQDALEKVVQGRIDLKQARSVYR